MVDQTEHVSQTLWARYGKRPFDLVAVSIIILVLSPVYVLIALVVKLTSPGPVFFSQVRTGYKGKPFHPRKFRSMRAGHKHDIEEIVPLRHPNITLVGRIIRRFKLDELPQLFSVLTGEMSLIGPRPTIPEQTSQYDEFQWRRLLVKPGGTGLAQVNSSAQEIWDERIKYDVYYVQHHGFRMDMGILLKTVFVILLGEERFARSFERSRYGRKMQNAK